MNVKKYLFYILIALEILMSFTFLGYVHIPPISITFAYIPVVIAGCFLGVLQSTVIGAIFGLSSMYKATAYYVMPSDQIFSPFLSGFPVESFILSVGTRMIFGLVMGLIFVFVKKRKNSKLWIGVVSFLATKIHAALVYTAMGLFFPESNYGIKNTLQLDLSNFVISIFIVIIIEVLWNFYCSNQVQNFSSYLEQVDNLYLKQKKASYLLILFVLGFLLLATISAFYFSNRISYMLGVYDFKISSNIDHDILHLQIQFLIAMFALLVILAIVLSILFKMVTYYEYLGQLDCLTGVMGRKLFFSYCENLSKHSKELNLTEGWYLFIDVDYFKTINDTFGHPTGDFALKEIARKLKENFGSDGAVGRIGGDEFVVVLKNPLSVAQVEEKIDNFQTEISNILESNKVVTCSMGICKFSYPQDLAIINAQADHLLYNAKKRGRNCYVIGRYDEKKLKILN